MKLQQKMFSFFLPIAGFGISSLCQSELEEPECDFNLRKFYEDAFPTKVSFLSVSSCLLRWCNSHKCLVFQVMIRGYILGSHPRSQDVSHHQDDYLFDSKGSLILGKKPFKNATDILGWGAEVTLILYDFATFSGFDVVLFVFRSWRLNLKPKKTTQECPVETCNGQIFGFFCFWKRRKKVPPKDKYCCCNLFTVLTHFFWRLLTWSC